ncbi:uncharacterized protein LOC128983093 [Macrosteles quadrilineatus]|uniref:uncharacterized protein LOC128983093 n=1 Tax=Macrosteles quadrilineatus TaxID=74068 RepID=UPI0023E2EBEF|nr:uncharacterized protein LOC128983093 [Macrosteles quadrilineatus]
MSIVTISVDVIYSNAALSDVLADPSDVNGLQFLRLLSSFVTWNYPLYIMACVCYRSHQLSNQVKTLKWSLDELQTKGNLDMKILNMVCLFETRINERNMHFSAFGSINFDVSLIIIVLNKIVTYLFAISPTRQQ